jgi:acetyltransferase-like isoleucine patch superfamily enzyme
MTYIAPLETTFVAKLKQGGWLVAELLLRLAVNPRLRARLLQFLGAEVGGNVRVYEGRFFNLQNGFSNLHLADDVHIGTGSMLDLAGPLHLDRGVVVSPGTILLTHSDPGAAHDSPLAERFPPASAGVSIASYVWIGAGVVILDGVVVGDEAVIAAGAVVTGRVPPHEVWGGVPARRIDGG